MCICTSRLLLLFYVGYPAAALKRLQEVKHLIEIVVCRQHSGEREGGIVFSAFGRNSFRRNAFGCALLRAVHRTCCRILDRRLSTSTGQKL